MSTRTSRSTGYSVGYDVDHCSNTITLRRTAWTAASPQGCCDCPAIADRSAPTAAGHRRHGHTRGTHESGASPRSRCTEPHRPAHDWRPALPRIPRTRSGAVPPNRDACDAASRPESYMCSNAEGAVVTPGLSARGQQPCAPSPRRRLRRRQGHRRRILHPHGHRRSHGGLNTTPTPRTPPTPPDISRRGHFIAAHPHHQCRHHAHPECRSTSVFGDGLVVGDVEAPVTACGVAVAFVQAHAGQRSLEPDVFGRGTVLDQ
jgi:hypothetical protein